MAKPTTLIVFGIIVLSTTGCEVDERLDENIDDSESEVAAGGPRRSCGTRNPSDAELEEIEVSNDTRRGFVGASAVAEAVGATAIRVWFHVIDQGPGLANGEVPDFMLEQQIQVLNASYSGRTGGARTPFRFTLEGITRTRNATWFNRCGARSIEADIKGALRVGGRRVLNIYTCEPGGGVLGWATFPRAYQRDPQDDGVVLRWSTLPGGGEPDFNLGYTGTHEVGHWLGLLHTFQGGCEGKDDRVRDTPRERSPSYGCRTRRNSCRGDGGHDPVHNFMDYSDDDCLSEFTRGQVNRMENMWANYRR